MYQRNKPWILSLIIVSLVSICFKPYLGVAESERSSDEMNVVEQVMIAMDDAVTMETGLETEADLEIEAEAQQEPEAQTETSTQTESLYPITALTKMLENERFALYLDEQTANLRVVEKHTGHEWLGNPQVSRSVMPNLKRFIDSPVHIRYTTGADISQTYTLRDEETELTIIAGHDLIRVEFKLELEQLEFALEYRLHANGLEVTIPFDSLKERGDARFISLEPLPFMNAAAGSDDGAILLPDGSGALMQFKERHPMYLKGYSEEIYGPDHIYSLQNHDQIEQGWVRSVPPKELVALPVFGIYRNGLGVLGIVHEGEFDTRINGTPAGIRNIELYRTSAEFILRRNDVIFIGSSGRIPYYQGQMIPGDRTIRYVLLSDEDADYIGMAKAYRNYLIEDKGVVRRAHQDPRLQLDILGGLLRDEVLGHTFIRMTTFEQVQQIIDRFVELGMGNIGITLSGWSKDGLYGDQPDHFPVERKLGGAKGLRSLLDYTKERGIPVYLKANYVRPYAESDGFQRRRDLVRGLDREIIESWNYYVSTRWRNSNELFYWMKPDRAYERYLMKEINEFASLGITGVQLDYIGDTLYSDQDPKHVFSRKQTADIWRKALQIFQERVGSTSVDYGFSYVLGHVDRINNIPLDSSHFIYMDQTVPFYQLVIHGLIPYTAKSVNLRSDARLEFLRTLEYGAIPSFELTYESTSKLQRTMEDRLVSSQFEDWLDEAVTQYAELESFYTQIAGQTMEDHEQVMPHVFRTTYANGVFMLVNYSDQNVMVDGIAVPSLGYAVGGRQ